MLRSSTPHRLRHAPGEDLRTFAATPRRDGHRHPRATRAVGVGRASRILGTAVVAALATWGIVVGLGVELLADTGGGPAPVGAADVAAAALVAGLAAWAASSIMARGGHARWWPLVSTTVVSLSMIPPAHQADSAAAVALCGLHLVVAAVLVAGFDDPRRRARRPHVHG